MKPILYPLALIIILVPIFSCEDDLAELPTGHTDVGVPDSKINDMIAGNWTKYLVAQTTYSMGQQQVYNHPVQNYQYTITKSPSEDSFIFQNFPASGQFEVRRYGARFTFYNRSSQQRWELMLDEVTPTKIVFKQYSIQGQDYFYVITHTLMK